MAKFMKNDIAELLRRGLDYDAYKRVNNVFSEHFFLYGRIKATIAEFIYSLHLKQAEGLMFEQNMLTCYELIEKFIGSISDHLEDLTKQRCVFSIYIYIYSHTIIYIFIFVDKI